MVDPRNAAQELLGLVVWHTEVSGFCRWPGKAFHTGVNGKRDCRVNVDGAPTFFCFHSLCARAVAEANHPLPLSPWARSTVRRPVPGSRFRVSGFPQDRPKEVG